MPAATSNRFLSALSDENRDFLVSKSTPIRLSLREDLYDAEETPSSAYFITSGMASVVTSMGDGGTAEVGVIGSEGIVGSMHLLGPTRISTNAFVQLEGTALRIPFSELRQAYRSREEVRDRILEFVQEQAVSTAQIAGCNRLHGAEERLARWLLMAQDRTQSDVLDLTQEFLAMMLGTRRTTVTFIAGTLQKAGLIEHRRGRVRILNRATLEVAACACYPLMKRAHTNLYRSALAAPMLRPTSEYTHLPRVNGHA